MNPGVSSSRPPRSELAEAVQAFWTELRHYDRTAENVEDTFHNARLLNRVVAAARAEALESLVSGGL
jgi:hypothetical protein